MRFEWSWTVIAWRRNASFNVISWLVFRMRSLVRCRDGLSWKYQSIRCLSEGLIWILLCLLLPLTRQAYFLGNHSVAVVHLATVIIDEPPLLCNHLFIQRTLTFLAIDLTETYRVLDYFLFWKETIDWVLIVFIASYGILSLKCL